MLLTLTPPVHGGVRAWYHALSIAGVGGPLSGGATKGGVVATLQFTDTTDAGRPCNVFVPPQIGVSTTLHGGVTVAVLLPAGKLAPLRGAEVLPLPPVVVETLATPGIAAELGSDNTTPTARGVLILPHIATGVPPRSGVFAPPRSGVLVPPQMGVVPPQMGVVAPP